MSKITSEDIQKLGLLARVGIGPEQAEQMTPQLKEIFDYVARLQAVSTDEVGITSQVTGLEDVWREDEVKPSLRPRAELLQNAPDTQDGYIKVRRVL